MMTRQSGLLVVNRSDLMRKAERSGSLANRTASLGISAEEVFRRYRGFDGEVWPMEVHTALHGEDGLGNPSQLQSIEEYARKLPSPQESDIILLVRRGVSDDIRRLQWRPIGFDVGFFESEWSHFSVILHEVIWG